MGCGGCWYLDNANISIRNLRDDLDTYAMPRRVTGEQAETNQPSP